jgi:hypothetical protein
MCSLPRLIRSPAMRFDDRPASETVIRPLFAIASFAFLQVMIAYFFQTQIRKAITAGALK